MSFFALAISFPKFDPNALGGWGSFAVGAVAVVTLFGTWRGIRWAFRLLLPKAALERDKANALRRAELSDIEAQAARAEATSARNEAASWRSAYAELKDRIEDIELRIIPKFTAALKLIKALLDYIEHIESAMASAKVQFPETMRMPPIPLELQDDIPNT